MDTMNRFFESRFVLYAKAPEDSRFYATDSEGGYKVKKFYQSRYMNFETVRKVATEWASVNKGWAFQIRELTGKTQKILETIGEHDAAFAVDYEAEKRKQKEEERASKAAKYHYFGEELSAGLFAKACNQLEKKMRYNDPENGIDGVLTNAEFVEKALENGYVPSEHAHLSKNQDYWTTPKEDYKKSYMIAKNGVGYVVNKTVYNYAVYLQDMKHLFGHI